MTTTSDESAPTPRPHGDRARRAALEARRAQALADLAEVDAQVADGELDEPTATRLRARYGTDLAEAITALDAPPLGDARAPTETNRPDPDVGRSTTDTTDTDEPPVTRPRRRAALGIGLAIVALIVVGVLAQLAVKPRSSGSSASGGLNANATTDTTRDLSTVSNQEMEDVIAANPDVVPMRLALIERYLQAGDATKAHDHAQEAFNRATTTADKARTERYLGWSTSLLGNPSKGASLLTDSLTLERNNPDALWFLAIVEYRGLNQPAAAVPLLQQLLGQTIPDAQRKIVSDKLDEINRVIAGGPTTDTTP